MRRSIRAALSVGAVSILLSVAETTDECRDELAVIISEACTNAVVHSVPDTAVDLCVTLEDRQCILEIGNQGETVGGGIARLPADPLGIGGRGLPLMATLADSMAFVPAAPGHVLLRLTKRLPCDTAAPDR